MEGVSGFIVFNLTVGQLLNGLQYLFVYSFREIIEAMTGTLPTIPYTDCRCPETHPRLLPSNPYYCMKNGVTTGQMAGKLQRLSAESHPPEYLVDGEVITYWLSEKINDVTIELDLKYSRLQVCSILDTFEIFELSSSRTKHLTM